MATNVKFLTGSNTDNLPAYSQNTIGQIYFIVDTTNKDSSLWNGKLIYDSPQGRLIMSTRALTAEYAEGFMDKKMIETFFSDLKWDETYPTMINMETPSGSKKGLNLGYRLLSLEEGGVVTGVTKFTQVIDGIIEEAKKVSNSLTIGDKTYNGTAAVTITGEDIKKWIEMGDYFKFVGYSDTALTPYCETNPIVIAGASYTPNLNDVVSYNNREYFWDGDRWHLLGIELNSITFTPSGTINDHNITPKGSVTINPFTPSGTISAPEFTGNAVTLTENYTPSGTIVANTGNANYTPNGSLSMNALTPSGSVASAFEGTQATLSHTVKGGSATVSGTFIPTGTIASTTDIPTSVTSNYTPEGTVSAPTFTGQSSTVSVSGTPKGTNAASAVTISPTTTSVYSMSSTCSVTKGTAASFTQGSDTFTAGTLPTYTQGSFNKGTLPNLTMDITDGLLTFGWSAGTLPSHGSDTFNKGTVSTFTQGTDTFTTNTPTAVTLPSRTQVSGLWNGYNTGVNNTYAAAQVFTGESFTSTGTTVAKGTISAPTFTGKAAYISFTGTEGDISASGSVSGITVNAHTYTPQGNVNSTFTGSSVTPSGSFVGTGVNLTFSGATKKFNYNFTPSGTLSAPIFTGNQTQPTASFKGTASTYKHTFTGTQQTINLNN